MNLTPYVIGWAVLATVVIVLALYRKSIASREDDVVHISSNDTSMISNQQAIMRKLGAVDRWGKTLTVIALVYGLGLAAGYLYMGWEQSSNYMGR